MYLIIFLYKNCLFLIRKFFSHVIMTIIVLFKLVMLHTILLALSFIIVLISESFFKNNVNSILSPYILSAVDNYVYYRDYSFLDSNYILNYNFGDNYNVFGWVNIIIILTIFRKQFKNDESTSNLFILVWVIVLSWSINYNHIAIEIFYNSYIDSEKTVRFILATNEKIDRKSVV